MEKIVVVIPSYKNEAWAKKNLESVLNQTHDDFTVTYTDDNSPDRTVDIVMEVVNNLGAHERFTLIAQKERLGAIQNLYNMIHACDDNDIVVTLDGDDWLAHNKALERIDEVYSDPDVWFTWGSYMDYPNNSRGCSKPIPRQVIDAQRYRYHPWCTSHLRTFKAKLFKKIEKEDFYDPAGQWLDMAWDLSFYMPFVEMGGHHGRYVDDILYVYNNENPIQDYKMNLARQAAMDRFIRTKKPYPRLEAL